MGNQGVEKAKEFEFEFEGQEINKFGKSRCGEAKIV